MAISDKLTYLNETKSQLKDMINYGLDEDNKITSSTTFRNYVSSIFNAFLEALRTPDTLFTNLPKKSGSGSVISLNDTANAPMRIELGASELTQAETPTPSSPQAVHTISGSNTIKVESKNQLTGTWEQGTFSYVDNTNYTDANRIRTTKFAVQPSTEYTFSCNSPLGEIAWIFYQENGTTYIAGSSLNTTGTTATITTPNNAYYIRIRIGNGTYPKTYTTDYHQRLDDDSYISQEADIDLGVPNLFTGTNRLHERYGLTTTTTGNRITINGSASNNSYGSTYFNLNGTENANANYYDYDTRTSGTTLPAGTYRVSATNFSGSYETTGNINLRITYFTSSNPKPTLATITLNTDTTGTFTLTEETTVKIQIQIYVPSGTTVKMNQFAFDIELIKGSTQQRGSFNPIEYCKIGNYEDKIFKNIPAFSEYDSNLIDGAWYIKKNILNKIFNGTEEYTIYNSNSSRITFQCNMSEPLVYYAGGTALPQIISSHFIQENQSATWVPGNITKRNGVNAIYFVMNPDYTIETFKTWLTSNNVKVYTQLATPTYTQITGTLANQLENVYQKLLSYSGTTNISQVNNDLGFVMSVSAIEEL